LFFPWILNSRLIFWVARVCDVWVERILIYDDDGLLFFTKFDLLILAASILLRRIGARQKLGYL